MNEGRRVSNVGRPVMRGATRSALGPPRPRKSKRGWIKPILTAAALIAIWQYFKIQVIEVRGAEALDAKAVELAAEKGIDKQLLGENLITLSANRLEQSVIEQIPEIKGLEVKRQWPTRLVVTVTEREPSLAWQSGGELYLLDRDGTVIREIRGKAKLSIVVDKSNLPVRTGTRIVPERFVLFAIDVSKLMKNIGGGIKQMYVEESTSELNVAVRDGYRVEFDTARGAGSQVGSLKLVLAELQKQGKLPHEYVNLTVEGKSYSR